VSNSLETKKRSLFKTILWRIIATANSYLVLCIGMKNILFSALLMNLTGFFVYYFYERIWSKIKWGLNKITGETYDFK
jgi:uncharacterized membrane protein